MGDFNIDLLKYNYCNFSTEFFNQFSSSGYTPLISKPTRITKSTATLIDNIFTNNLSKTEHLNGILLNDISDHFPIFTITEHELQKCPKTSMAEDYTARIITKKSLEAFCCKIKNCDWQSRLSGAHQMEPPSTIQALGINPFPSRFTIRTVPRGDFARRR